MQCPNHALASDKNHEFIQFRNMCKQWFSGTLAKLLAEEKTSYILLWLGEEGQEHHSHWTPPIKDECPLEFIWKNLELRTGSPVSELVFRYRYVDTRLNGGSDKSCDQRTLLTDTVDTIAAAGEAEITIYTDGSAESGYKNGGSAAVVTSGPATDPVKITSISRKGRRLTSSYEKEVTAMLLAVSWIKNREDQDPFIICTDSQSTLMALHPTVAWIEQRDLAETRRILNSLNTRFRYNGSPAI